jgi:iduronate 2-sulfatase
VNSNPQKRANPPSATPVLYRRSTPRLGQTLCRRGLSSLTLLATLVGLVCAGFGAPPAPPPDVLFIISEDLATCMGSYGNRVCQTPNLDALAASGLRFDNAQCMFPVCNPTRSSFLRGLHPRTTQVLGNAQDWNEHLKPGTTLPEYFRANGYLTMRCGKIFHAGNGGRDFSDTTRWDTVLPESAVASGAGGGKKQGGKKGSGKGGGQVQRQETWLYSDLTPEQRNKEYDTRAWVWGPVGTEDTDHADGRIAEQAVKVLRAKQEKPLFLALGFHKTHLPLFAPKKYFDLYPPEKIPLPKYAENCLEGLPHGYSLKNHQAFTDEKRRQAIAAYYASASYMDACVGRVLHALKETGRDRNTIVVFMGDHGFHMGEHLLWQKMTLFEESSRVPLIIRAPGVTPVGGICKKPVSQIDLYPTLADLCGLGVPSGLEGISMAPLLRDPSRPWKKGAFTTMGNGTSVRTERYRYTEWGGPGQAELYDHETDARELRNLAKDPKFKDVVAELSALIKGGWKAALPAP